MRKGKIIIAFGILLLFIPLSKISAAQTTQWFPQDGTVIEYKLSNFLTLMNGTRVHSENFNIYNSTPTNRYIIPSYYDDNFAAWATANYDLITRNIKIISKHTYTESSATELTRTRELIIDGVTYDDSTVLNYVMYNDGISITVHFENLGSSIIKKSDYFDSMASSFSFLDYIDNSLGPGENCFESASSDDIVLAATDDNIIVFHSFNTLRNRTHIADSNGKVNSFIVNYNDAVGEFTGQGIVTTSFVFTVEQSNILNNIIDLFTNFDNYIGLGIVLVAGLLIGLLIGKKRK